jgi:hypothetical protein
MLQRRDQRAQHERVEQRLGHHRPAHGDERHVHRAQPQRDEPDAPPPQLRREHADERHDRGTDERLRDPRHVQPPRRRCALHAEDLVDAAQEVRVAGRAEGGRAAVREHLRIPLTLGDRPRMDVVVARVVAQDIAGRRLDVGDAQRERAGDEQQGRDPHPRHAHR